jgi:mannose-1-phosphate guanylyltransferase
MDIRAIIMAGGAGTRFWPLSRKKKPKQFLPIISDKTMIEETVQRLSPLLSPSQIYTVADRGQSQVIKGLFPFLPEENFLVEPQAKNTAPSLLLATAAIFLQNPEAAVVALPADHLIKDQDRFLRKLEASAHAALDGDHIVTFGIPPLYPATGYGYIQFKETAASEIQGETFFAVERFKEKPSYEKAKKFLDEGNFFWNSGMFLWQAKTFPQKLEQYAPQLFPYWEMMIEALKERKEDLLIAAYEQIPSISIDYALMEKAQPVWMCRGDFGWSDVGAWSSLAEIWEKDSHGNALRGESLVLDSEGCLLFNPGKITALVGVKDLLIVDTDDALLICCKDLDQNVKEIVESLKKKGRKEYI